MFGSACPTRRADLGSLQNSASAIDDHDPLPGVSWRISRPAGGPGTALVLAVDGTRSDGRDGVQLRTLGQGREGWPPRRTTLITLQACEPAADGRATIGRPQLPSPDNG